MIAIFLDIDGVLNDHQCWPDTKCGRIRQENMAHLNTILGEVPEAQIVLSSAWRYCFPGTRSIETLLASHGCNCIGRVHGRTKFDPSKDLPAWTDREAWHRLGCIWRLKQITWYAAHHKLTRWVVLDDLPLNMSQLVQTDPDVGLTAGHAHEAIKILRGGR